MVQTPVGARCRECARVSRLPTFQVPAVYYLRAAGAAVGAAVVCGLLWGFLEGFIPYFYIFNIILGGASGFAIAEVMGLAVNRKRGTGLAVIAGFAVLVSYLIAVLIPWGLGGFSLFDLLAIGAGVFVAVTRIK